jgi:hypothetical protein
MTETFKDDRAWHYDVPDDDATLAEKIAHQRKLRKRWESISKPSDMLAIPREDPERWWTHPEGVSPELARAQLERQMKRLDEAA